MRLLTSRPAEVFGIRDRGRLAAGLAADVAIFDPQTVGCAPLRRVRDLPAGADRLVADATASAPSSSTAPSSARTAATPSTPTAPLPGRVLARRTRLHESIDRRLRSAIPSSPPTPTSPSRPTRYTDYIDAAWRDRAPRIERHGDAGDVFVIDGMKTPVPLGLVAAAGKPAEEIRITGARFEELHRGGWDPDARLADQERDGVAAEVIYPTVGMLLCNHKDFDYKRACFDGVQPLDRRVLRRAIPTRLLGMRADGDALARGGHRRSASDQARSACAA